VVSWIEEGIPLLFASPPVTGGGRPNYVPLQAVSFVGTEVSRLFVTGAIELDDGLQDGYTMPLGAVPKDVNKWRMVLDVTDRGQGPNAFMTEKPFKMEHLDDLLGQIGKGWWALTFDLRAGFHHVKVQPQYRRWLRFRRGYSFILSSCHLERSTLRSSFARL